LKAHFPRAETQTAVLSRKPFAVVFNITGTWQKKKKKKNKLSLTWSASKTYLVVGYWGGWDERKSLFHSNLPRMAAAAAGGGRPPKTICHMGFGEPLKMGGATESTR
jgi:hypothetical protein